MSVLIVRCSLNSKSRSDAMALKMETELKNRDIEVNVVNLKEVDLPFCDGGPCYENSEVHAQATLAENSSVIIMAMPIYMFDVNAAAKNWIELVGRSLTDKTMGFLCAAGGQGSYMSVMSFANSLMLDFRCLIIPRFVYATYPDFEEVEPGKLKLTSGKAIERITELANEAVRFSKINS